MTSQEEHWRQVFLDAYRNNTGDARRLALNEAWFAFVSSEDFPADFDLPTNITYTYWTALVDAAHAHDENSRRHHEMMDKFIYGTLAKMYDPNWREKSASTSEAIQEVERPCGWVSGESLAGESVVKWMERYRDKGEATLYVVNDEAEARVLTEQISPKKDDEKEDS